MDLQAVQQFVAESFAKGEYSLGVAMTIMVALFAVSRMPKVAEKIKDRNVLAWISLGSGVLSAIVTNVLAGKDFKLAVIEGLMVGAAASGLWSTVGKTSFGQIGSKKAKAPEPAKVEEEDTKKTRRRASKRTDA